MPATVTSPACWLKTSKVREYLKAKLKNAAVSRILIERPAKNARITIYSARPGCGDRQEGETSRT